MKSINFKPALQKIKLQKRPSLKCKSEQGFIAAEFLFSFTMVIGCGLLMFAFTFSLAVIEISQYIVWSAARSGASGHHTIADSEDAAKKKYKILISSFPLLTGAGADRPWYKLSDANEVVIGDLSTIMRNLDGAIDRENKTAGGESRHPWYGVQADIDLILFKNLNLPFLGRVTSNPDAFKFPVRAFIFRHPSIVECQSFFEKKFSQGILQIPGEDWGAQGVGVTTEFKQVEDNGC